MNFYSGSNIKVVMTYEEAFLNVRPNDFYFYLEYRYLEFEPFAIVKSLTLLIFSSVHFSGSEFNSNYFIEFVYILSLF